MNIEEHRARKRAYNRAYYAGDPKRRERKRARDKIYRESHKAERVEYDYRLYASNPLKLQARARLYREAHPERSRIANEKYYGLPAPTRPCPPLCELCGRPPGKRALHNDHCHETGKFRGWLCGRCNKALGLLGDTETAVLKAVAYFKMVAESGAK